MTTSLLKIDNLETSFATAGGTVRAVDGHWKITGLELLEERRLEDNGIPPAAGEHQAPQYKGTL